MCRTIFKEHPRAVLNNQLKLLLTAHILLTMEIIHSQLIILKVYMITRSTSMILDKAIQTKSNKGYFNITTDIYMRLLHNLQMVLTPLNGVLVMTVACFNLISILQTLARSPKIFMEII